MATTFTTVMRLRWLLIAVITMSLMPSLAAARSQILPRLPESSIGAAVASGAHAGTLVVARYNMDDVRALALPDDSLVVELSSPALSRTLRFATVARTIEPHAIAHEPLELDPLTADLPPGEYDVRVIWDGHEATTKTFVPYRCALRYTPPPPAPRSPSKLPYVLGGLALAAFVVGRYAKRAGTADVRVPCSAP